MFILADYFITDFSFYLNIGFVVLIFSLSYLWEYSVINRNFDSEFKIRSQRKVFELYDFLNAIVWTSWLFFGYFGNEITIFMVLIFWTFPLTQIIMWFIYRNNKPYTLFIKENEMILNKRFVKRRNPSELTQIRFNQLTKNLRFEFETKSGISVKITEYKIDDIQILLEKLIKQSENKIMIPQSYQTMIKKNSC